MISALTVSNRSEWMDFCRHQVGKQSFPAAEHIVIDGSQYVTIGEARTAALAQATQPWLAWFDDDDWQHPDRLLRAKEWFEHDSVVSVGNRSGWMVSTGFAPRCALRYPGYGTNIFNGSVFRTSAAPHQFQAVSRGEDVSWVVELERNGTIVTTHPLQHVWLCHERNIVNQAQRHVFEEPLPSEVVITAQERALIP